MINTFLLFMSMSPLDGKFASRFLFELKRVLSTRVLARSTPIRFVTVVFFSSLWSRSFRVVPQPGGICDKHPFLTWHSIFFSSFSTLLLITRAPLEFLYETHFVIKLFRLRKRNLFRSRSWKLSLDGLISLIPEDQWVIFANICKDMRTFWHLLCNSLYGVKQIQLDGDVWEIWREQVVPLAAIVYVYSWQFHTSIFEV